PAASAFPSRTSVARPACPDRSPAAQVHIAPGVLALTSPARHSVADEYLLATRGAEHRTAGSHVADARDGGPGTDARTDARSGAGGAGAAPAMGRPAAVA